MLQTIVVHKAVVTLQAIVILSHLVVAGQTTATQPAGLDAWYVDSLKQVLLAAGPPAARQPGRIDAARGEVEAIQLAVRCPIGGPVRMSAADLAERMRVRIRTVGRVPIVRGTPRTPVEERIAAPPAELPDPLFPGAELELKADRTECFWLDVSVPHDARPGSYRTVVRVSAGDASLQLPLEVVVHQASVPFECSLMLTNWFSVRPRELGFGDAPAGSEAWFAAAELMFQSMWEHRQNMFWTPLDPPWIKPVVSESGGLAFDFSLFDAWVEAFSRPRGGSRATYIEGQPIAWREGYNGHVKARVWRLEEGRPQERILEVGDPAAREGYRELLIALRDHLREKDWLDRFRIHITDEPHGHQLEPYRVLAGYVREFAPEFRIMEALDVRDDFEFFDEHCDVWVPQLGRFDQSVDRLQERLASGKEVWFYTCLYPRGPYPNRFVDFPLVKTRILPWINFRWGFTGYLHWGWNQWRGGDPFTNLEPPHDAAYLPPGDGWIVYPGDRQIIDSIRHEALRDGVEDYELLKLLAEKDGAGAGEIAASVVRSFTDYVRDETEFRAARRRLLEAPQIARELSDLCPRSRILVDHQSMAVDDQVPVHSEGP